MNNLRRNFERFCFQNRDKGIPNLMLYISLGTAVVYLISTMAGNFALYNFLAFSRTAILHGQVWRLITYPLTLYSDNILFMLITLFCYYSLGTAIERQWGTFRFNLFYFTGVVLMDIYAMIFGVTASVYYLNMSLFLSFATMYPQAGFLLFFVIPVKAWVFALFDLIVILAGVLSTPFTASNFFPLIALANYFLFFGKDVLNVIPVSWMNKLRQLTGRKKKPVQQPKVIIFQATPKSEQKAAAASYNHRCTICGRTDVSHPELEFRYCSKCNGYYCYCSDHISNHTHIQ